MAQLTHLLKVTQLPGLWLSGHEVLSALPDGRLLIAPQEHSAADLCISIFSNSLFFPCSSPPHLPLSLSSSWPAHSSLGLSALLSHFLCLPFSHHPFLFPSHLQLCMWGVWAFRGPLRQMPSCPSLSLGPGTAAVRVGKGQTAEAAAAKPERGTQLWLGKKRGNKELGERGCGVTERAKAAQEP